MASLNAQIEIIAVNNDNVIVKSIIANVNNSLIDSTTFNLAINTNTGSVANLLGVLLTSSCQGNPNSYFHNYLSSFVRFFGDNAKQDVSRIYIKKSDLTLTTNANNRAESLVVALLLRVMQYESDDYISRVVIKRDMTRYVSKNNFPYVQIVLTVKLYLLLVIQGNEFVNYNAPHIADTYQ